jgi:hypothetical protein
MRTAAYIAALIALVIAAAHSLPAAALASDPDSCISFIDSGQTLSIVDAFVVALGDLDDDGDLDAFIIGGQNPAAVWYNDGGGIYSNSGQSLGLGLNHGVALGDLDGDGDLDAFVVNNDQPDMVYLNDSSGVFTDSGQRLGLASEYGNFVWLADLDGDDDLDAAVRNYIHQNVIWYNDGTGTFDSPWAFGGDDSGNMGLGDLDGDGDVDMFMTNGDNPMEVWLNDGSGRFSDSGQRLGSEPGWRHVEIGDLDGDDDLDAVITNATYGCQVWFNDGDGLFGSPGAFFGDTTQRVALADIEGDGDLDACTTDINNGNYVWVNDGTGAFASAGQILGDGPNLSLALGDLDNDGDLDAFLGGALYGGSNEPGRVYINESCRAGVPDSHSSPWFELRPVRPNPFSGAASVCYFVNRPGIITVTVYDVEGRHIRTLASGMHSHGAHSVEFDAAGLASGVYFCNLTGADGYSASGRLLLAR